MASIFKRKRKVNGKTVPAKTWTIQYKNPDGRFERLNTEFTDKGCARQKAAEIEREIEHKKARLVDEFAPSKARKLAEHIADFKADLKAKGRSAKYIQNADNRLTVLMAGCQWASLSDITADSFIRWRSATMTTKRKGVAKHRAAVSAETVNQYLDTARAFLNWCASVKRIEGVPVGRRLISVALSGVDPVWGEKARKRRAFTDAECARLLSVASDEREIVYRTVLATGIRREELEALQWGDLRLAAIKPFILLRRGDEIREGRRIEVARIPCQ